MSSTLQCEHQSRNRKQEIINNAKAIRDHREIQEQLKSPVITGDNENQVL